MYRSKVSHGSCPHSTVVSQEFSRLRISNGSYMSYPFLKDIPTGIALSYWTFPYEKSWRPVRVLRSKLQASTNEMSNRRPALLRRHEVKR